MKQDWHQYGKKLESAERSLRASSHRPRNKELVLAFKRQLVVDGLSQARILSYMSRLPHLVRLVDKDLDQYTKDDVMVMVEQIERWPHSEYTKHTNKVVLKRFFRWLRNTGRDYPEEVKWIRANVRKDRVKLVGDGDLVTPQEVELLIETAQSARDKAFVSTLYESGARVGEIGTLRVRDVVFEKVGCRLNLWGKTGARPVLVVNSTHYLAAWLAVHPDRRNRDAPLWVNTGNTHRGEQMNYANIRKLLYLLFKRAGIRKRSKAHNFRHACASHLAPHLTEAMMNHRFGWVQASRMPAVYVHLNGKDVDGQILRLHGIDAGKDGGTAAPQARSCARCEYVNPASFQFCGRCGGALDVKAALEAEEHQKVVVGKRAASDAVLNELLQDEEVRELLRRKLTAIRS
ncbi:MAG: site-specific integrase [Planctomycetota bacterium]|nr:site-specific integrase [Planctomycetota bacterium]